ncbi:unnamed protein product [Urochloa humidicola]
MEDSVPEERNPVRASGMKESTRIVPEETLPHLYFWRKQKMSPDLREIFPAARSYAKRTVMALLSPR